MNMFGKEVASYSLLLSLFAFGTLCARAQSPTQPPPASDSATSLTSSSPTLTLPGSLTLTSTVAAPKGGGVPTGTVNFDYDTSNSLGKGNLVILPKTQAFPTTPSTSFSFGSETFPFWATTFFGANVVDLAIVDQAQFSTTNQGPVLTIFPGLGRGGFDTSAPKILDTLPTNTFIDSLGSGDFHKDGKQEFLVHVREYGEESGGITGDYIVVDSSLGMIPSAVPGCAEDGSDPNCNFDDPDNETVVVDDFTGDGYADVASLVSSYLDPLASYVQNSNGVEQARIRIAVNSQTDRGRDIFTFGANATLPVFTDSVYEGATDYYCPTAIASGQFRTGGNKDIVSIGVQSTWIDDGEGYYTYYCETPSSNGYLVLLLGDGKGGLTSQSPVPLGSSPSAVGVGDFNHDGKLDVVVADSAADTLEFLYGNGDGTFAAKTDSIQAEIAIVSLQVADFNGDGYPDIAAVDATGNIDLFLNARGNSNTGNALLNARVRAVTGSTLFTSILAQDMNGDGLPDITELMSLSPPTSELTGLAAAPSNNVNAYLNSASAQAVLTTAAQSLPVGPHTLTATFPGDLNFNSSTSAGVNVTVAQTTPVITWQPPAAIEYGTPLNALQLNATASVPGSFAYNPAAGTILTPGTSTLSVTFAPTDAFNYTPARASVPITVMAASLSSIVPTTATLGSPGFALSVVGQGFTQGATVHWNGSALVTSYVDLNHLTAQVPATLLTTTGTATVTVVDPGSIPVSGSATFTVSAPAAVATATGPQSSDPGTQPSVQMSLDPYPADVTVTLTLSFAPAPPNEVTDPTVLFANGTTVDTFVVPANSTTAIPPINLQTGTTAGTITIATQLTAGGANITPSTLVPVVIVVPAQAPVISSARLTRNGESLQLVIDGFSSSRDMSQADFHFTAASGASLKTTDLTVSLTSAFTTWYQSDTSTGFGTAFEYTQPFTLDSPATDVQSVTVTLTNSIGKSQPASAQ